jgi:hypothetical protein
MKTILHSQMSGRLLRGWRVGVLFLLVACALVLTERAALASDPVGVFALIDKVTLEPNETTPERIAIHGTFAVAEGERGGKYTSPEKGVLYFKLPEKKSDVALKEWTDLKSAAGKKEVIGFFTRYGEPAKVRQAGEKLKDPQEYRTGFGLVRMDKRPPTYQPVKALLDAAAKDSGKQS